MLCCRLVAKSCLTLCDPMDCSPPVSSVHGISQAKYWSGLPFPSPRDLPDPGIEPGFPALQADSLPSEPPEKTRKFVYTDRHLYIHIQKKGCVRTQGEGSRV